MTADHDMTFIEKELSTIETSVFVDSGEVRLSFHSSMSVTASGKNKDHMRRISRFLPDFKNGPGIWIHKRPFQNVTERPVESGLGEVITVGGKRKSTFGAEGAEKKAKVDTREVKSKPSQSQPMTMSMAQNAFETGFVERVRGAIVKINELQAKDDAAKKIISRRHFVAASEIDCVVGAGANKRKVKLEFGVNVTNFSIVSARSGGECNFEGGPRMLAQFMLREKPPKEGDDVIPIVQFSCTVDEMLKILCDPNLKAMVSRCTVKEEEKTVEEPVSLEELEELEAVSEEDDDETSEGDRSSASEGEAEEK